MLQGPGRVGLPSDVHDQAIEAGEKREWEREKEKEKQETLRITDTQSSAQFRGGVRKRPMDVSWIVSPFAMCFG